MRMLRLWMLVLAITPAARADEPMSALAARYYQEWAGIHPSDATWSGLHDHDAELDDYSAAGVARQIAWLHDWAKRWQAVDAKKLTPSEKLDLEMVKLSVESQLVSVETIEWWRRRPDLYSSLASQSVYNIIKRDFAPEAARLKLVVAREKRIPALLGEARKNLTRAPRIAIEIALSELPGIIDFFKTDVPTAFPSVKDPALVAELASGGVKAREALAAYADWLKAQLARAPAEFAIGEAAYRKKLNADEMVDAPLDELLARGEAELRRLQSQYRAEAAKLDAKKSFSEVQKEMSKDHPPPARLIAETQSRLAGLRQFLVDKHLVGLPSPLMPKVQETPAFMRATTEASLDSPGPLETRATETFFNVTLPDPAWKPEAAEDYMRGAFNNALIDNTAVHEAFPGHYLQFLWLRRLPSEIRKMEGANSNIEGWAHYSEQLMVDEGYGGSRLRLAQLQDALLRASRYVVGIRMHTRGMTLPQATEFFQKEGYQPEKVAEMEAKRGTEDPTYLYYTLGKLEILRLRDDYKKKLGAAFTLQKFHDAFLAEGALPIPLMRRALLGN